MEMTTASILIVVAERLLQDAIYELGLLLFTKLKSVFARFLTGALGSPTGFLVDSKVDRIQVQRPASF